MRNVNLDIARMAFALVILWGHMASSLPIVDGSYGLYFTFLSVEFFFFVSGYLLMSSVRNKKGLFEEIRGQQDRQIKRQ